MLQFANTKPRLYIRNESENSCITAFLSFIQPNLYPTVGLQTPGEVVDANFGQSPFVFNIEDLMREMRARTRALYERIPVPDAQGEWQHTIQKSAKGMIRYCLSFGGGGTGDF